MLVPIDPPPGVLRQATTYQAGGAVTDGFGGAGATQPRWTGASLVRWYGRQLGPIGGWRRRSDEAVSGKARAIVTWKTLSVARWIGIGTHTNLYVQTPAGQIYDITPADFVAGAADESVQAGFGLGLYGAAGFGTPRLDTGSDTPALVWDLDIWGEDLVACASSDGRLLQWTLDTGTPAAAIAGAPTGCLGVVVTEQGFAMALGAGGDARKIRWSAQADITDWTPSGANQAGEVDLVTPGAIVRGLKLGPMVLVLTDTDAHAGRYQGLPYVYVFERAGYGCGAMSKGCLVTMGPQAVWWSKSGFWIFDGSARPIECEVFDFLTRDLNVGQKSKISGFHNAQYGEAWWFYPSSASVENDSYVCWDYRRGHWNIGSLSRLCAAEPSVFKWPLAVDAAGLCYEHEVGGAYDGAAIWAQTGPVELGGGDRLMACDGLVADLSSEGVASFSFSAQPWPDGAAATIGVTPGADGRGFARFEGRQTQMRVDFEPNSAARLGRVRLELSPAGRR